MVFWNKLFYYNLIIDYMKGINHDLPQNQHHSSGEFGLLLGISAATEPKRTKNTFNYDPCILSRSSIAF
jgi:hypothetical protein